MNMLVARAQLNVVEEMLAEFANPPQTTQLLALVQAQHVAIVTLLRAVGHVLEKVDADTPARKAWLLSAWKTWKTEPIFANFIELNRNQLLKEFRGGLGLKNPALTPHRRGGKSRRAERCFVGRRLFAKQRSNRRWA